MVDCPLSQIDTSEIVRGIGVIRRYAVIGVTVGGKVGSGDGFGTGVIVGLAVGVKVASTVGEGTRVPSDNTGGVDVGVGVFRIGTAQRFIFAHICGFVVVACFIPG